MHELVGVWRLVSAKFTFAEGDSVDLYGSEAQGRVLFTADGWMTVLITGGGAPSADGGAPAPVTIAYSGRYRAEAERFITNVDVSSIAPWIGTEQARSFTVSGEELSMVLGMPTHPAYPGRTGVGRLLWKRERVGHSFLWW